MMKKIDTWLDIQKYLQEAESYETEQVTVAAEESVLTRS
jgi:hypothetical protein